MSRIRIIGGTYRSRLLSVLEAPGLRPTPDRVRETLFNWLGQQLDGRSCLDLFAGSGVLGFESASRGAARVVMVETDARVCAQLRDNIAALGASAVTVTRCDAVKFLSRYDAAPFDLIFLDPPYRQDWLARVEPLLHRVAHANTLMYAEAHTPIDTLGPWHTIKRGKAGQVNFQLMAQPQPHEEQA